MLPSHSPSPNTSLLTTVQNIAVRKYLERRAKEKEQDEKEKEEAEKKQQAANAVAGHPNADFPGATQAPVADAESTASKSKKKKGMWGFSSRATKNEAAVEDEPVEGDVYHSPRPAFYAHARPSRRNQIPRDVAIPYFRFRKDRFYDWPPDPTVSRATPIFASGGAGGGGGRHGEEGLSDVSMHKGNDLDSFGGDQGGMRQRGRRQRNNSDDDEYGYG